MTSLRQNCTTCNKTFLIIDQEQEFLKQKNLPFPTNCPTCRQIRRLKLRGGERTLYKTKCQKCQAEIVVTYNPTKISNAILCKKDYEQYLAETDLIIKEPLLEI